MQEIETEYLYKDENSNIINKVIRYKNPKGFCQAQYINGEWKYNIQNVRRVPYNLPNIIKSEIIYWVEGEKDADNLNKLGLVATTTAGGAQGFNKYKEQYKKYFKDKIIYIIPDNDKAGMKYAEDVFKALCLETKEIKILNLTDEIVDLKEKSDISDILLEYGTKKTLEIIENLKNKKYKNNVFPIEDVNDLNEKSFEKILQYLGIIIKYNVITKKVEIFGMPEKYAISDYETILPIYLKQVLRNKNIKINDTKRIEELIVLEISKNNYNPILELLENNHWDGIDRLEKIYNIFHLENDLDKKLLTKWLKQCVAMLLNNIKKPLGAEGILTLQGKQGIGKTRILSLLSLNPEWFVDGVVIDMNNKDSLIKATSYWICEFRRT